MITSKKKDYGDKLRGNIHFFSGDKNIAKKYFDLGFTVSFTGVITFTNDYDDVIKYAPLENILSETDSPYVSPVPHRGERNEPIFVSEVVKRIAEVKEENYEKVRKMMVDNALRVFNIR
jgi:TatD DNase family protein